MSVRARSLSEIGSEAEQLERAAHQVRTLIASAVLHGRRRAEVETDTLIRLLDAIPTAREET